MSLYRQEVGIEKFRKLEKKIDEIKISRSISGDIITKQDPIPDSTATSVKDCVTDINLILSALRNSGLIETDSSSGSTSKRSSESSSESSSDKIL